MWMLKAVEFVPGYAQEICNSFIDYNRFNFIWHFLPFHSFCLSAAESEKKNKMRRMNIIVAVSSNFGIGYKNGLPWKLKKEFQYFTSTIKRLQDPQKMNAVVFARKTWESIPPNKRPMKGRVNVVVTTQKDYVAEGEDVYVVHSLEEALELLSSPPLADKVETIWNLGGATLYQEALEKKYVDKLYLTRIQKEFEADVFFPKYNEEDFVALKDAAVPEEVQEEDGVQWTCHVYQQKWAQHSFQRDHVSVIDLGFVLYRAVDVEFSNDIPKDAYVMSFLDVWGCLIFGMNI